MKKYKICKILLVILSIFLCVVFYESFGICIAYKKQPEVSNTIKKETQNDSWNERSENMERAVIIEKNPEALLQRVRLIRNAKEDKAGVNGFLIFKMEYLFLIFILILNTPCGW